jgi:hypothetical protein
MQREGEKVLGRWTGRFGAGKKPVFQLTNVSGRPLVIGALWTFYYAADGEELNGRQKTDGLSLKIATDATVEVAAGAARGDLDPETKIIEVAVPEVRFSDGKQESWRNENLVLDERPMRASAKRK